VAQYVPFSFLSQNKVNPIYLQLTALNKSVLIHWLTAAGQFSFQWLTTIQKISIHNKIHY